jgi:hypothetical protein
MNLLKMSLTSLDGDLSAEPIGSVVCTRVLGGGLLPWWCLQAWCYSRPAQRPRINYPTLQPKHRQNQSMAFRLRRHDS